jgi:hypothetical protein
VAGFDESSLNLILQAASAATEKGVNNIAVLIGKSIPRLAFSNTRFARELLQNFSGEQREILVQALAQQARRYGHHGVYSGKVEDLMAQEHQQFVQQANAFQDEGGLEDLAKALRRFT